MTFFSEMFVYFYKKGGMKKGRFFFSKLKKSYNRIFYYPIKISVRKFENDCLKTVVGDRFLMNQSIMYIIWNNKLYAVKLIYKKFSFQTICIYIVIIKCNHYHRNFSKMFVSIYLYYQGHMFRVTIGVRVEVRIGLGLRLGLR